MNIGILYKVAATTGSKVVVKLAEHSPKIMVVSGIGSMIAGTVVACKCTTKAEKLLEEHAEAMKPIAQAKKAAEEKKIVYTNKDAAKDTVLVYTKSGAKFVKLYAPAIGLTALGIALILTGHHILAKRHLAMAAAYTALNQSYSDYRKEVASKYGSEYDIKTANGISESPIEVGEVAEDGKVKKQKIANVVDPNHLSIYSLLFDDMYSTEWTPNPIENMQLIKKTEEYWDQMLQYRSSGFVYLYEPLKDLGMWDRLPIEKQRQLVGKGWVRGCGDDHISFGIIDVNKVVDQAKTDFINGFEPSVLLDFNCDGDVASLL